MSDFLSPFFCSPIVIQLPLYKLNNIYVGRNVNPNETQGDVIVNSNTNVIFDANNNTFIKNGFVIESGSTLSVK